MRGAIYARNSKPPRGWRPRHPGEEPPSSWRIQAERCRAAALAAGDEIVLVEHDIVTGADPKRPGWDPVDAAVRGGTVRRVYATKIDRPMHGGVS